MAQRHDHIEDLALESLMEDRFGRYSKYIIQDRALPDVRDGLKPVQRRILFAMYQDGNHADRAYRKSAKSVGLIIGNYHPHGDSSVYEAMVRMSQDWKMGLPLIDMQGNNGSIDDDPPAAMRYTEARLAKAAHALLGEIDEDVVDMAFNFDDTLKEPTVLPAGFCNLLVNGAQGISAGYATNIPPFNFNEIMNATIYRLQFPTASEDAVLDKIQGPDFPTGAIIQGKAQIRKMMREGYGALVVRAKTEFIRKKQMIQLVVTEIPYGVNKSELVRRIEQVRMNQHLDAITDIRDESDRNGLRVVVDMKADAQAETIRNLLFRHTPLQVNFSANMVAIVDRSPKQLGVVPIIDAYIKHRREVTVRRSEHRLAMREKRIHIIQGLIKAMSILDEVIRVIRASSGKADARQQLVSSFAFTEAQAEAILIMQLYRLSNTDVVALREEFAVLSNEIEYLKQVLAHEEMLRSLMVSELRALNEQYKTARRSMIEDEVTTLEIDKEELISNDRVRVAVSRDGYVKRVSLRSWQSSDPSEFTLKSGDVPLFGAECQTLDRLILFTDQGNYLIQPVYELPEHRWKEVGTHIGQLVRMNPSEKLIGGLLVNDFTSQVRIVSVSRAGYVKTTRLAALAVNRMNKTYVLQKLRRDDVVVSAIVLPQTQRLILATRDCGITVLTPDQLPVQNPGSSGVRGLNLRDEDAVIDARSAMADDQLVIISDQMSWKRVRLDEFNLKNRPAASEVAAQRFKKQPQHCMALFTGQPASDVIWYAEREVVASFRDVSLMQRSQGFAKAPYDTLPQAWLHPLVLAPLESTESVDAQHVERLSLDLEEQ